MAEQRDINRWKKGKDHWNKWAEGRLKAKEKLEREGKWGVDDLGLPANAAADNWAQDSKTDFSGHNFSSNCDFNGLVFPGEVSFERAKFHQPTSFGNSVFIGLAWFKNVSFLSRVEFTRAEFESGAHFDEANFEGLTNFMNAKFFEETYFRGVTYKEKTIFSMCDFKNNIDFLESKFLGGAIFVRASFRGDVYFDSSTFEDAAWFPDNLFEKATSFDQCTFEKIAHFDRSVFCSDASFSSSKCSGPFSLVAVKFKKTPDFNQISFHAAPRFDNLEILEANSFQIVGDKNRAARYRALKKLATESHDHVRELDFFASETKERRGNDDHFGSGRYILGFIYELFSDFGRSIFRPLMGLLGTWLVMAAAYGTAVPAAIRQGCVWTTTWLTPEHYLSLLHTLPFVGLVRSGRRELALKCLYGSKTGFGAGTDVLFIAHNTFAAVLIFLFFLAVRNHFKIK